MIRDAASVKAGHVGGRVAYVCDAQAREACVFLCRTNAREKHALTDYCGFSQEALFFDPCGLTIVGIGSFGGPYQGARRGVTCVSYMGERGQKKERGGW
jgi:hypothetical protein